MFIEDLPFYTPYAEFQGHNEQMWSTCPREAEYLTGEHDTHKSDCYAIGLLFYTYEEADMVTHKQKYKHLLDLKEDEFLMTLILWKW